jgi:hypothetical protein
MDYQEPQFLEVGTGEKRRRIAYRLTDDEGDLARRCGFPSHLAVKNVSACDAVDGSSTGT